MYQIKPFWHPGKHAQIYGSYRPAILQAVVGKAGAMAYPRGDAILKVARLPYPDDVAGGNRARPEVWNTLFSRGPSSRVICDA